MGWQTGQRINPQWGRAFGALVGLGLASYFFLPMGAQSLLYDSVAVGAALVMFAGVAITRPQPRFAWVLLAWGTLLLAAGDVAYGWSQPVPSPADMLYVSAYPILALGFVGLTPRFGPGRTGSLLIHAAIVAAGIGVVTSVLMLVPSTQPDGVGLIARAVALAYPLMDLALGALLIRAIHFDPERRVPLALLGAGIVLRLIADTGFALLDFGTSYGLGDPLDIAWLLSYACFGVALLHPSMYTRAFEKPFGRVAQTLVSPLRGRPPPSPTKAGTQARRTTRTYQTHALRLRVVLSWTGRMLLALGLISLALATVWKSPNLILLAGAYAGMGSVILVASFVRA